MVIAANSTHLHGLQTILAPVLAGRRAPFVFNADTIASTRILAKIEFPDRRPNGGKI
jgi:hypothetical protein